MINRLILILLVTTFIMPIILRAQNCPENIGFANGDFKNWKMYVGSTEVSNSKNIVTTTEVSNPIDNRHTLISDKTLVDPYGGFPIVPNNGGGFSVKLGNNGTGAESEGISYLINVPADKKEFTLTYQYAVVLEDPSHTSEEQPRFIARVKDVDKNEYIPCASFEYIATANLPGFKKSNLDKSVIYKEWTAVTVNLSGYQGKQLILEFLTADCTLTGHFGYAYVDVNNLCGELIVGNNYCKGSAEINLSGPSGFKSYNWYNADRSIKYGASQSISIKPALSDGSILFLDLIPYDGFGCPSTLTTIVNSIEYNLLTLQKDTVCYGTTLNLTTDKYILNRKIGFDYLVYEDKNLTQEVKDPIAKQNKTYYIKATNYKGCETISTIGIVLSDIENIVIINPIIACYNETVDITKDEIYEGNLNGIVKGFFADLETNIVFTNPKKITENGTYYIKLTNNSGCSKVFPIEVKFNSKPKLVINDPQGICFPGIVDISNPQNFSESDADLNYSFYKDEHFNQLIIDPTKIDETGVFYVKAVNSSGCVVTSQIHTKIYNLPVLVFKNPEAACYPETVDITNKSLYLGSSTDCTFTFYSDINLTTKVSLPAQIAKTGTYFVKLTNANGCYTNNKIDVVINQQPIIVLNKPGKIFDYEYIDLTSPEIIKGSQNFVKVDYFSDRMLSSRVPDPTKVNKTGTYYISITNNAGCSISAAIELDILSSPKIIVPTAFTPQLQNNNRLFPFLTSIKKLISFKVYNKWGILVYETNNMQDGGWDGQFKSRLQPLETFSWFAEGIDVLGGKYESKGKTIMIL